MDLVYNFLEKEIKLNGNDNIVVGVSAGPDSMALLYILIELRKKYNFKIIVAHINHNIREESKEEEEFLRDYCAKNNVIFESMIIKEYGDDNFHNEARNIRYNFYHELIKKYGANYLMTGHHGDDLIETILMRIVRGSTIKGYSGFEKIVDMQNYKIIRPLIYVTKEELENFDKENNIPYRIDKSNYKDKYTRNRYRKYVLPFLKQEDTRVHEKFLKFSESLQEYDRLLTKLTNIEMARVYKDGIINVNEFKKTDILIERRIIDYIFSLLYQDDLMEIDNRHVDLVIELINSSKASSSIYLPNDYLAIKEYDKVYFKKKVNNIESYDIELNTDVSLPNGMTLKKVDKSDTDGNDILRINSKDVKLPLHVRTRHDGDRMTIKNMSGTKKVSDILINSKIPASMRNTWPIVTDSSDKIIWIPKVKKSKYNRLKTEKCDIIFKCL